MTAENIDLAALLKINDAASAVFTLEGGEEITDALTLNFGVNTVYLTVTRGEAETVYTVTIIKAYIYTVTFDFGNGNTETQTINEGGKATMPTKPERVGYNFIGWYVGENEYNFDSVVTSNFTIEAQWEIITYTVEFYDGENIIESLTKEFNVETPTFALPVYVNGELSIRSWYAEAAFENAVTEIVTGTATNIKLYGKWGATVYTVTYVLSGGTNAEGNPDTYTAGSDVVLGNATREGYKFAGWYTDTQFKNNVSTLKNKSGDLTLYAKWVSVDEGGILTPEDKFN